MVRINILYRIILYNLALLFQSFQEPVRIEDVNYKNTLDVVRDHDYYYIYFEARLKKHRDREDNVLLRWIKKEKYLCMSEGTRHQFRIQISDE